VEKILQTLVEVQLRQERLEKEVGQIMLDIDDAKRSMGKEVGRVREDVEMIKLEIGRVGKLADGMAFKMGNAMEGKLVECVEERVVVRVKDMKEDLSENMEVEKRKMNLVFHGIKEGADSSEDEQEITRLLNVGLRMDASRKQVGFGGQRRAKLDQYG
jgi:hypothetical protein